MGRGEREEREVGVGVADWQSRTGRTCQTGRTCPGEGGDVAAVSP